MSMCYAKIYQASLVVLVPSIAVGKICDFGKHVVAENSWKYSRGFSSRTIECSNRANKFVEFVQVATNASLRRRHRKRLRLRTVRRHQLRNPGPGVVYESLASKPSNCLPSPSLSNITIHSSSPVSFSVLHLPIILHCHHSLAVARIGHAARHFVKITMTTNFVSLSGDCPTVSAPTVNHEMQRVRQRHANPKNPTVNVTRFPYAPIAMAVTNDLLFGGVVS